MRWKQATTRVVAACALATMTHAASAVVIDFDDLTGGFNPPPTLPANASPFATFSTEPGAELLVFSGAGVVGTSSPNNLTASFTPSSGPFDADIYIDFIQPVNDLMLVIAADNDAGSIATLNVFESGAITQSIIVTGNGDFTDAIPIDLTSFSDVTRVELVDITDTDGLSIDDISFDVPPIPEPATLLLLPALLVATPRSRARGRA